MFLPPLVLAQLSTLNLSSLKILVTRPSLLLLPTFIFPTFSGTNFRSLKTKVKFSPWTTFINMESHSDEDLAGIFFVFFLIAISVSGVLTMVLVIVFCCIPGAFQSLDRTERDDH